MYKLVASRSKDAYMHARNSIYHNSEHDKTSGSSQPNMVYLHNMLVSLKNVVLVKFLTAGMTMLRAKYEGLLEGML